MSKALAHKVIDHDPGRSLFAAIGRFLDDQRLAPDPAAYSFAHRLLSDPDGPLARSVAALTDGGVRLTGHDIAELSKAAAPAGGDDNRVAALASQTEVQMRDFGDLIARVRSETSGFGRQLAASVDSLTDAAAPDIVRLTAAMLERVQTVESRLADATSETEALREQLEQARGDARSDALTGLPNRRALLEDFAARTAAGAPLCLAVCDIDHFKRINDRFGHPVGDRVLRAIAGALGDTCGGAFVTRYGGEEFAVLFSGADLAKAVGTLDRARAHVAAKSYRRRDDDTPLGMITFSAGVVAVAPGESFDDAFMRADTLLYAAKADGRNQIQS